jgi:hypothetical protein
MEAARKRAATDLSANTDAAAAIDADAGRLQQLIAGVKAAPEGLARCEALLECCNALRGKLLRQACQLECLRSAGMPGGDVSLQLQCGVGSSAKPQQQSTAAAAGAAAAGFKAGAAPAAPGAKAVAGKANAAAEEPAQPDALACVSVAHAWLESVSRTGSLRLGVWVHLGCACTGRVAGRRPAVVLLLVGHTRR